MPDVHSHIGASGAKRWLACPPSALLEVEWKKTHPDQGSVFAEEGTAAHELAELKLKKLRDDISGEFKKEKGDSLRRSRNREINKFKKSNTFYNKEMDEATSYYVSVIEEKYNEALARDEDAILMIEERVSFETYAPEGFGTADCAILGGGVLEVIDLKYGKGIPVEAPGNPQIRLYGLGVYDAYSDFNDIDIIRNTIIQPRLDSVSEEELSAKELVEWGLSKVKPRAELAVAGKGELCAGEHCRFCAIKSICKTRAAYNQYTANHFGLSAPDILSREEISNILSRISEMVKWANDVKEFALDQAVNHGTKFPGYKLVRGRSNRVITDIESVKFDLEIEGYAQEEVYDIKLKGIGGLEKALGKKIFNELLGDYVEKPEGKPTLVPESDERDEMSGAQEALNEFDEINEEA